MIPPTSAWSETFNPRMNASTTSATLPPKRRKKSANGSTTPSRIAAAQFFARGRCTCGSSASRQAAIGTSISRAMARYTIGQTT